MRKRRRKRGSDNRGSAAIFEDKAKINSQLVEKLKATGKWRLMQHATAIQQCGAAILGVRVHSDGSGFVCRKRCNKRPCAACDAIKSSKEGKRLGRRVGEEMKQGSVIYFWTPTMKHSIKDSFWALRKAFTECWKLLTNRSPWSCVAAYYRRAEIERNRIHGWNVHFHVLLVLKPDCKFAKWSTKRLEELLRKVWLMVTASVGRPSPISRLKRVRNRRQAENVISEMVKYVTKQYTSSKRKKNKGVGLLEYNAAELEQYMDGIKGWNLVRYGKGWRRRNRAEEIARKAAKGESRDYSFEEISSLESKLASGKLLREEAVAWLETRRLIACVLHRDMLGAAADALLKPNAEWIDWQTGEVIGG